MSYVVISVYGFSCDRPGCDEYEEVQPNPDGGKLLDAAFRELRETFRWAVRGSGTSRQFLCPDHKTAPHGGGAADSRPIRPALPVIADSTQDGAR